MLLKYNRYIAINDLILHLILHQTSITDGQTRTFVLMKDDELRQYLLNIRVRLARAETLQRAILKKVRPQDEGEISVEELVERLTGTSYDNPNKRNTQ